MQVAILAHNDIVTQVRETKRVYCLLLAARSRPHNTLQKLELCLTAFLLPREIGAGFPPFGVLRADMRSCRPVFSSIVSEALIF